MEQNQQQVPLRVSPNNFPKILILGHKGYLGSHLYQNLPHNCHVLNNRDVYDDGYEYDYIINCIGKPDLEFSQENDTRYANWWVMRDIKKYYPKAKVINFSSYYVYDQDGFCSEDATTTRKYKYCRWKLCAERENSYGINFRIGKLFGNSQLKQGKLTDYIIDPNNKEITLDTVKFNPTSVQQVLRVVKHELSTGTLHGAYNLSNLGHSTHYDYGKFIVNYLGLETKINKIKKMDRSFDNYGRFLMNTNKLNLVCPLMEWEEDIAIYLEEYKASVAV